MGDLELRARARDAAALDSPEARARVLVERLRAGTLTAERVGLAAYCGSPEADAIIDLIPQAWRYDLIRRQFSLGGWVRGLVRWGPEVQVRAAVSSALLVLATPGRLSRAADEHAWRVLEEAHTWLADPCAEHRLAWGRAFVAARPQDRGVWGAFLPAPYARPEEVPTDEAEVPKFVDMLAGLPHDHQAHVQRVCKGRVLACWCRGKLPMCHGDPLAHFSDGVPLEVIREWVLQVLGLPSEQDAADLERVHRGER